jgi:hypothetical protein
MFSANLAARDRYPQEVQYSIRTLVPMLVVATFRSLPSPSPAGRPTLPVVKQYRCRPALAWPLPSRGGGSILPRPMSRPGPSRSCSAAGGGQEEQG